MCYWVLIETGKPIARSTVAPITDAELSMQIIKEDLKNFDNRIITKLSTDSNDIEDFDLPDYLQYSEQDDNFETPQYEHVEPKASMPEADEYTPEEFDKYISAEVLLPKGNNLVLGKLIGRKRDGDDNPIGVAHKNPIFDTRLYQVQFPEGQVEELS
jgi:hypothetical protein